MKIQRVQLENGSFSWIVLNHQGLPISPILSFLRYLYHVEKSPHTVRNYANHLKLYWEFLELHQFQWQTIQLHQLGQFVYWLRQQKANVISLPQGEAQRTASTVNCILSVLSAFYRYHKQLGHTEIELTQTATIKHFPYRSLLHHLHRQKPIQKKILS